MDSITIVISGISGGIGKYLAKRFCNDNFKVIGIDIAEKPDNLNITYARIDITDFNLVAKWINDSKHDLKNIILLNCVGISYNSFAHKSEIEQWGHTINVNLVSTFNLIRILLPIMRRDHFGRIINFSSVVAQMGVIGASAYASSKAGLWGMTKCVAVENANKGITINNLNLGYFDIGIISEVPDIIKTEIKNKIPNKNLGQPENIYNAIKFIIDSDYINGSSIDINGALF